MRNINDLVWQGSFKNEQQINLPIKNMINIKKNLLIIKKRKQILKNKQQQQQQNQRRQEIKIKIKNNIRKKYSFYENIKQIPQLLNINNNNFNKKKNNIFSYVISKNNSYLHKFSHLNSNQHHTEDIQLGKPCIIKSVVLCHKKLNSKLIIRTEKKKKISLLKRYSVSSIMPSKQLNHQSSQKSNIEPWSKTVNILPYQKLMRWSKNGL